MPAVARGDGEDTVATNHGCVGSTFTDGMSSDVFVNGTGIHRQDDDNASHAFPPDPPCTPHTTAITTGSTTVFANYKGVARVDDAYSAGETVSSGSDNVNAGP